MGEAVSVSGLMREKPGIQETWRFCLIRHGFAVPPSRSGKAYTKKEPCGSFFWYVVRSDLVVVLVEVDLLHLGGAEVDQLAALGALEGAGG